MQDYSDESILDIFNIFSRIWLYLKQSQLGTPHFVTLKMFPVLAIQNKQQNNLLAAQAVYRFKSGCPNHDERMNSTHRGEMAYRTPADVKEEFRAHPRRALILTTVVHESRAVKAYLRIRKSDRRERRILRVWPLFRSRWGLACRPCHHVPGEQRCRPCASKAFRSLEASRC